MSTVMVKLGDGFNLPANLRNAKNTQPATGQGEEQEPRT
jgi:hypothetical protein